MPFLYPNNKHIMKFRHITLTLISACIATDIYAQGLGDAVRFSQNSFGGTARFNAMAGSMGALGGDMSCMATNPGGIAVYRKSEFAFSPSLYLNTTKSTYMNSTSTDGKLNFNFGNIGYVGSKDVSDRGNGWQSIAWGIGYNRQNNFHRRLNVGGFNSSSSMVDAFLKNAQGVNYGNLDPYSSGLAYNAFLIDTVPGTTNRYYEMFPPSQGMNQNKYVSSAGSAGETDFSFGGNYLNKLYIGATMGFAKIRYDETANYEEYKNEADTAYSLRSFTYDESLTTRGGGVNFKFGIIYRPLDWVRIGGAVHSPTYFTMTDDYTVSLSSHFDQNYDYNPNSQTSSFNYSLYTPAKALASIGFVIAKRALLNAEYEYIDYRTTRFSPSRDFKGLNNSINTNLQATNNIKVGGEVRLDPFTIRGGYALYGDAYNSKSPFTSMKSYYTFGYGYRTNDWYLDFTYILNKYNTNYYLYDPALVQSAHNTYLNQSLICTLGFKF